LPSAYVASLSRVDDPMPGPALPEVALVGRSNVGKSSLLNLLVGRKALARTSRTPGKTRTLNVYRWGEVCYLVDLPGYGWSRAGRARREQWRRLVERYLAERELLAGVIWLLDIRREPSPDDLEFGSRLSSRAVPALLALTKVDTVPRGRRAERAGAIARGLGLGRPRFVLTSSRAALGAEELRDAVLDLLA
jgi:GTP-binding protein